MKTLSRLTRLSLFALSFLALLLAPTQQQARAAERTLVGIKTFSPIGVVLKKYGDPTFISTGTELATIEYAPEAPILIAPGDNTATQSPMGTDAASNPSGTATVQDAFDPLYDRGSRYYYNFPQKGLIYEFVSTSAGRVVEVKVYGYHGPARTALGIGLGSTYAAVVLKYGYPESTVNEVQTSGDVLTLNYTTTAHVAFRLVRNKVAAISIVAPD